VLGEITVVVAGRPPPGPPSAQELAALVAEVHRRVAAGVRLKQAVAEVATDAGVSKRELYDAVRRPG
jgi:16S rRNA (cytidine1402-2'-O)-methyltransferase